jgi:Zn-dependent alcohol dehydrogenase
VGLGAFEDVYQYSHAALVSEEKAFRGSFMGSCVPERDIRRYTKLYLEGKLPVDRLKSGVIGFAVLNANLDALERGDVVRQVLPPHG